MTDSDSTPVIEATLKEGWYRDSILDLIAELTAEVTAIKADHGPERG